MYIPSEDGGKHANPYIGDERSSARHEHHSDACPSCHPTIYAELYSKHAR